MPEGVEHVRVDRADEKALRDAVGDGADVLVDFVAFEREHAEQLLSLSGLVGSLVVLSTASVYTDGEGRTLEEAKTPAEFPRYPVPIRERQPTVVPGGATYSTKKAAIERVFLDQDALPATLIRAGAIYGPGGSVREWYFVKRVLDRRRCVILGDRGRSRFHPISTENLAELIWLAAERPGRRVLNAGDPGPPTVLEISRAVAAALDHDVRMARRGHEGPTLAGADAADGGVPAGFLRLRSGRRAPRRARHGWLSLAQTLSSSLATTG